MAPHLNASSTPHHHTGRFSAHILPRAKLNVPPALLARVDEVIEEDITTARWGCWLRER